VIDRTSFGTASSSRTASLPRSQVDDSPLMHDPLSRTDDVFDMILKRVQESSPFSVACSSFRVSYKTSQQHSVSIMPRMTVGFPATLNSEVGQSQVRRAQTKSLRSIAGAGDRYSLLNFCPPSLYFVLRVS